MKRIGRLCIITDTFVQKKYSHAEIAKMAIKGGADIIQFRDKYMSTGELIETAFEIKRICEKNNLTFIINDRIDIAMIVDADGVHLGKEDIPINDARTLLGKNVIIGVTAHNLQEARSAQKSGADYIGFGHIFKTESKVKNTKPKGLNELKKIVSLIKIPILAVGGINFENSALVMKTGVHGIAVIGSVVKSESPIQEVKKLKKLVYAG